jgi:hypothetical protein
MRISAIQVSLIIIIIIKNLNGWSFHNLSSQASNALTVCALTMEGNLAGISKDGNETFLMLIVFFNVISGCHLAGINAADGDTFPDPRDRCRSCTCLSGELTCQEPLCPTARCKNPARRDCCPVCDECDFGGQVFKNGQIYNDPRDECRQVRTPDEIVKFCVIREDGIVLISSVPFDGIICIIWLHACCLQLSFLFKMVDCSDICSPDSICHYQFSTFVFSVSVRSVEFGRAFNRTYKSYPKISTFVFSVSVQTALWTASERCAPPSPASTPFRACAVGSAQAATTGTGPTLTDKASATLRTPAENVGVRGGQ